MVTDECNFNCAHCMRGASGNCQVSDETIENLFNQVNFITNLCFCGGEPLMAIERINKIIKMAIKKKVIINTFGLATNGTHYGDEIDTLFAEFEEYVAQFDDMFAPDPRFANETKHGYLDLSWDEYHTQQLMFIQETNPDLFKIYAQNIQNLRASKFFGGYRIIANRLFDEGNARNLKILKTQLQAVKKYWTLSNDILLYGPLISVKQDGMISECDGSLETLRARFNYGNINHDALEDIIYKTAKKCRNEDVWHKKVLKSTHHYIHYH